MPSYNLTCILCPLSCQLELLVEAGEVQSVFGNTCQQGVTYAQKEYSCPTRMLTATIALEGGKVNRIPVRTQEEIPKSSIKECMAILRQLHTVAPVTRGEVIIADLNGTGVDLIASRSMDTL